MNANIDSKVKHLEAKSSITNYLKYKAGDETLQKFVRTVNTSDAFKMKLDHLEREYKIKMQSIKEEIAQKESELSKYNMTGVGGQLGGGFLRVIGWAVVIFSLLVFLMGFTLVRTDGSVAMVILFIAVVILIIGIVLIAKGASIRNTALSRQQEVQELSHSLETELEQLRDEMQNMEQYYQDEMVKQKLWYEQHMLNQQELLEQEVSAIRQADPATANIVDDTKECPQCAETVKAKARICRFCHYEFA
ncbi:zinc ribbon domain-containing protein [Paenibacillus sp. CECT 9249]|uniref:zinc ribbon domain-containing protein n=1 Tax=Paenibacillus sp. CECT 9249 TaxID=2845385 RepID=UPI001E3A397B|nr:zinc ribbon domain-containing protein [Paenibacillus sp. CECT 9249]